MLTSWQQYGETTITFNKDVKSLKRKTRQTQDDIEDLERKLTEKINKLKQEVLSTQLFLKIFTKVVQIDCIIFGKSCIDTLTSPPQ